MSFPQKMLSQASHFVKGLDPVADAFSGTVYSDVVSVKEAHSITFLIIKGVGATGTSTVTVEACDDTVPTTTSAVAFKSRACTTADTWGALTARAAAGFVTTAGSSQRYLIHVDTDVIAASGYGYCRLAMVESVDSPVLGGIEVILWPLRHDQAVQATQI